PGAGEGPEIGMLSPPWRKPWQRSSLPDRHSASYRVPPPGAGEGWAWGEDRRGAFLWGYPDPSQPFRSLRKRFGCSGSRSGRSGNVLDAPETVPDAPEAFRMLRKPFRTFRQTFWMLRKPFRTLR